MFFAHLCAFICVCSAQPPESRTREHFATLMSQVSPAMTREEVEAILGKPDDVRTKYDPGGIRRAETGEIWSYGTNGHLINQALWLLDSVYEVGDSPFGDKLYTAPIGDREKAVEAISRLKLRWDEKKQDYSTWRTARHLRARRLSMKKARC